MSLLNVSVSPERVVIATDTAWIIGGAVSERRVAKCFALPQLPLAIALRGNLLFASAIFSGLLCLGLNADEIASAGPVILSNILQECRNLPYGDELSNRQQVAFAAFDQRAARMRAWLLEQTDPAVGFKRTEIETTFFAPGDADWLRAPVDSHSPHGMLETARQQLAWSRTNAPGAIGGELILTTVDRFSVTQVRAFNLDKGA